MNLPGPTAAQWVLGLVLLAAEATLVGEGVRSVLAVRIRWFRTYEAIERGLLDLYLAGALLYVLAVLPLGLFRPPVLLVVGGAAAVVGVYRFARASPWRRWIARARAFLSPLATPAGLTTLGAAVLLFAVELLAAWNVPTGNTFDSSVDATFTSLLTYHGQTALTLAPVSTEFTAYPQGPAAWFGATGWALGWSPAQVPLLLTPLFLALVPLSGFVVGRRWLGTSRDGALLAVGLAILIPGTRYFAFGSNDFALAFPLVLYLGARAREWVGSGAPSLSDAVAFGAMLGYSAALNPIGAEWLGLTLLLVGVVGFVPRPRDLARWIGRWGLAVACGLVAVVPSLAGLTLGMSTTRVAGTGAGRSGITFGQFVGWSDPFLFGPTHPSWSPVLFVQIELAGLLVLGTLLLWLPSVRANRSAPEFRGWVSAGVIAALTWELMALAAGMGAGWAAPFSTITSAGQMSVTLFATLGFVALFPLVICLRRSAPTFRASPNRDPRPCRSPRASDCSAIACVGVLILLVLPGIAATVLLLPEEDHTQYVEFSSVTSNDFAFLNAAPHLLPPGARVLVAPGSAAEFLPAYDPDITLLFPMTGTSWTTNASYLSLRGSLDNGTLGPDGMAELSALGVEYIAVTGNNTSLFPAFSPHPFLIDSAFQTVYSNGDAFLFLDTEHPVASQ